MPQPTIQSVHVDRPLTDISVAYIQDNDMYVADKIFPIVKVSNKSDQYYTYPKSYWLRTEAQERAPGTESAGSGYPLATATYDARVYSVHKDVDRQIRSNSDSPLAPDEDAAKWVAQQLMIKRDKIWAGSYFTTGEWDTDLTGVSTGPTAGQFLQWDQAGSTPIPDITNAGIAITSVTGKRANVIVSSPYVTQVLLNHPSILERIKYTQKAVPGEELLAELFRVEKFVTAWAVEEKAVEGAAASDIDFIFGKGLLLANAPASPSLLTPAGGYIMTWDGYLGAGAMSMAIERLEMPHLDHSTRIEGSLAFDAKLVSADLGTFFATAVG